MPVILPDGSVRNLVRTFRFNKEDGRGERRAVATVKATKARIGAIEEGEPHAFLDDFAVRELLARNYTPSWA